MTSPHAVAKALAGFRPFKRVERSRPLRAENRGDLIWRAYVPIEFARALVYVSFSINGVTLKAKGPGPEGDFYFSSDMGQTIVWLDSLRGEETIHWDPDDAGFTLDPMDAPTLTFGIEGLTPGL